MESAEVSHAQEAPWQAAMAESHRTGLLPDPPREQANKRLEAEITELWGNINAANYRFLQLVAEYDRTQGWALNGLANCAQWLNWQCGISMLTAREKVRVARALEHLPQISASFARGELSYSKVRAMTRIATPENESSLLDLALCGTASHIEKLVRKYRWLEQVRDNERANELHRMRRLQFFYDDDGSMIIHAKLPPEVGAVVKKAIETAVEALEQEAELQGAPAAEPAQAVEAAPDRPLESEAPPARSDATWTHSSVSAETPETETPETGTAEREAPASSAPNGAAPARPRAPWKRVETPEEKHEAAHRGEHATFHDSYGAKRADALAHLAECFLARRTQAREDIISEDRDR